MQTGKFFIIGLISGIWFFICRYLYGFTEQEVLIILSFLSYTPYFYLLRQTKGRFWVVAGFITGANILNLYTGYKILVTTFYTGNHILSGMLVLIPLVIFIFFNYLYALLFRYSFYGVSNFIYAAGFTLIQVITIRLGDAVGVSGYFLPIAGFYLPHIWDIVSVTGLIFPIFLTVFLNLVLVDFLLTRRFSPIPILFLIGVYIGLYQFANYYNNANIVRVGQIKAGVIQPIKATEVKRCEVRRQGDNRPFQSEIIFNKAVDLALAAAKHATIVIIPESVLQKVKCKGQSPVIDKFKEVTKAYNSSIFFQCFDGYIDATGVPKYKSIVRVVHKGELLDTVYIKRYGMPFSEDLPLYFRWLMEIPFIKDKIRYIGKLAHAKKYPDGIFNIYGAKISPLICFETGLEGYLSKRIDEGVNLFVALSNDNWDRFNYLRGYRNIIEYANSYAFMRSIIRAGYSGISFIISPFDDNFKIFKKSQEGVLYNTVAIIDGMSFYKKYGIWWYIFLLCIAGAGILLKMLAFLMKK